MKKSSDLAGKSSWFSSWDYRFLLTSKILGQTLWHSKLVLCLKNWNPMWVPAWVMAALLQTQLSANGLGQQQRMAQVLRTLYPHTRLEEAPGSQLSSGYSGQLGSKAVEGRSFSLCISFSLSFYPLNKNKCFLRRKIYFQTSLLLPRVEGSDVPICTRGY